MYFTMKKVERKTSTVGTGTDYFWWSDKHVICSVLMFQGFKPQRSKFFYLVFTQFYVIYYTRLSQLRHDNRVCEILHHKPLENKYTLFHTATGSLHKLLAEFRSKRKNSLYFNDFQPILKLTEEEKKSLTTTTKIYSPVGRYYEKCVVKTKISKN